MRPHHALIAGVSSLRRRIDRLRLGVAIRLPQRANQIVPLITAAGAGLGDNGARLDVTARHRLMDSKQLGALVRRDEARETLRRALTWLALLLSDRLYLSVKLRPRELATLGEIERAINVDH